MPRPLIRRAIISATLIAAAFLAALTHPPVARSGTWERPSAAWLEGALCVHSGWHYTSHRPHRGARPDYWLWGRGFWRTWKVPYGTGSEGEGAWTATSDPRYGGGLSFTLGTWNEAARMSRSLPSVSSAREIARQSPRVQLLAAWLIVSKRGHWGDWPQTSRACGLRRW